MNFLKKLFKGVVGAEVEKGDIVSFTGDDEGKTEGSGEMKEFKIVTVADLISVLEYSKQLSGDHERYAHQIDKIREACRASDLNPEDVRVERMPDGILGTYDPNNREIAISQDLLANPSEEGSMIKLTFVHEKVHKEGIHDEGLTQMVAERRTGTSTSIYDEEVAKTRKAIASLGLQAAEKVYDLKNPKKLLEKFIDKEFGEGGRLEGIYGRLLKEKKGDQEKAFQELMKHASEIATKESVFETAFKELSDKISDTEWEKLVRGKIREIVQKKPAP